MIPTTSQIEKVVCKYLFEPVDSITAAQIAADLKLPAEAVRFNGQILQVKVGSFVADVTVTGESISVVPQQKHPT